jgi:hypothetical protein
MMFRFRRPSLGGRLSLAYLAVSTTVLLFSRWPDRAVMVFGFPLALAPGLVLQSLGNDPDPLPAAVSLSGFAILWVANAYVWGHILAGVYRAGCRWLFRPRTPAGHATDVPAQTGQ